jgi:low temperature requirement protein LtrA
VAVRSTFRLLSWGGPGSRVTRLELFYDLVFVFAFGNVSTLATEPLTPKSLGEALLVLALLWWCWSGFAALGNTLRADQGIMPLVGFVVMAAVFVLAITTESVFHAEPEGDNDAAIFAGAYAGIWVILLLALWSATGGDPLVQRRLRTMTVPAGVGVLIVIVGGTVPTFAAPPGTAHNVRLVIWGLAVVVSYSTAALIGRIGSKRWRMPSVEHWAERHALIVLIALGETVAALGLGATNRDGQQITPQVIVAAVLGISLISALWWLYFDVLAFHVEQVLHGTRGTARIHLARDIYTYLHFPLISGIIIFSLGLERLLRAVIRQIGFGTLAYLYGGVILYIVTLIVIEARAARRVDVAMVAAAGLLGVLVPAVADLSPVDGLTILTGVTVALVVAQMATKRAVRQRVRRTMQHEQAEMEAAVNRFRHRQQ